MHNYRDTETLATTIAGILISLIFLMFTFIEMIDRHLIVYSPISIKYIYKLANGEAISFN